MRHVLPKAWYALRTLRPDMNLLMVVAVLGAIAIGERFEATTVACLFALSLLFERWSVGRAQRAVEALLDLSPPTVRVVRDDGTEADAAPADVAPGTRFVVRAGDRVALDGTVVEGAGSVDQASMRTSAARRSSAGSTASRAATRRPSRSSRSRCCWCHRS